MQLIIHRGTRQIGGSCVELRSGDTRILLDIGMPLSLGDDDAPGNGDSIDELLRRGVLPAIDGAYRGHEPGIQAVILSHAHQDHMGLACYVHESIPVYATCGTWALHESLAIFLPQFVSIQNQRAMRVGKPVRIGPFSITAHLVDHSAPDAVALEVQADGHRLLYSGDIRSHGRKAWLWDKLVDRLGGKVDTLVMEGTTIGRPEGSVKTEDDLEEEFVESMRSQRHLAAVFCSSHNLDRIVTIYRAALRTQKMMVIDLYTALVLMRLARISRRIPQFDSDNMRIAPWGYHQDRLQSAGMMDFLEHTASRWTTWREMSAAPSNVVLLARSNRHTPAWLEKSCGADIRHVTFVWSMWDGYWKDDKHIRPLCERYGVQPVHLHTSGHCTWSDIQRFVAGLRPGRIVPIHTEHAEHFAQHLSGVTLLQDGEALDL